MHEVMIGADGRVRVIYSDSLATVLPALGRVEIARASHVEPGEGGWIADMSPVGGELLGPFALRSEALAAEVRWLLDHGTPSPNGGSDGR